MAWSDIAWIVVICTSMNHLGLVAAAERIVRRRLPIVNCVKCSTFWCTLLFGVLSGLLCAGQTVRLLAVSFLAAYAAVWLELIMFFIDTLYNHIYDTLIKKHKEENDE